MNPKLRQPLILFIASFLPVMAGLVFKIQHWPVRQPYLVQVCWCSYLLYYG